MAGLPITLATERYDRTQPLADGRVAPAGVDLTAKFMPVEEIFLRMLRDHEFDAAELSLSSYVVSLAEARQPFVAIPVFPSRLFRHSAIYLRADAGIGSAADLAGRRIGLPTYEMTAAVWIRGILQEFHGLPSDSPTYVVGGLHDADREQTFRLPLPDRIHVEPLGAGLTLAEELLAGNLDAVYSAREPREFTAGDPRVRRLFPDPERAEREYFARSGVFPVMHVVAILRERYEENPWLAGSLFDAFAESKRLALATLAQSGSLGVTLPWVLPELARTRDLLGDDFWSYGLEPNRDLFATYLRYAGEQGLNPAGATPDDLFVR